MSLLGTFEKFDPAKEHFNSYFNRFLHFLRANAITDKDRQAELFLTILGGDTYNLLQSLIAPLKIDDLSLEDIATHLSQHYQPRPLVIMETYNFMKRNQKPDETAMAYLAVLRKLALNCEFGEYLERALRDKFVSGLESQIIQRRLLTETELTVTRAVEIAQTMELADAKAKEFHTLSTSVQRLQLHTKPTHQHGATSSSTAQSRKPNTPCPRCAKSGHWASDCRFRNAVCNGCKRRGHIIAACKQKNFNHSPSKTFNSASGTNQRNKRFHKHSSNQPHTNTHNVDISMNQQETEGDYDLSSLLHTIHVIEKTPVHSAQDDEQATNADQGVNEVTLGQDPPVWILLKINGSPVSMEFDPGAGTTLISTHVWQHTLGSPELHKAETISLTAYGGHHIEVIGQVNVEVESQGKKKTLPLVVVSGRDKPLLGRNWIRHIPLDWAAIIKSLCSNTTIDWRTLLESIIRSNSPEISIDWRAITQSLREHDGLSINTILPSKLDLGNILKSHSELFQNELGHCKNIRAHISLKENAVPKFYKARAVPYSIRDKVEAELSRIEGLGIITKVSHSEWAAPIVPVLKPNGSLRLCGGFHLTINPQINLERYPIPRPERLFNELNGGQEFSEIDLAEAYLQCELDDQSKEICVINTHKGLYRFNRLPFGVASAAAIFQEVVDQIIEGIPFVKAYQDDIIITGKTRQDHLSNLQRVLAKLAENCLRVRKEKCKFLQREVQFLGFTVNAEGRRPVETKIEAIKQMPIPKNIHDLRAFLGMITHYQQFIANLSALTDPLNMLLRKDVVWQWTAAQQNAFDTLKAQLTSDRLLVHYDPALPLGLSCDASNFGLGAVLFHKGADKKERPIAYASCTLTDAQRRYSQIEKEAASIIFGVNKFYEYIWGRNFILITDHKPLLAIFGPKKGFPERSINRLQRWAITLSAYTYDIQYRSTDRHGNADALSRLPLKEVFNNTDDIEINQIQEEFLSNVPVSSNEIRKHTNKDSVLTKIRIYMNSEWPKTIEDPIVRTFYENRNILSEHADCLFLGFRVVVPSILQPKILEELHVGHIGIVKMKSVARQYVWWPTIDKDIEVVAKSCTSCAQQANNPAKAPNHPWEPPKGPWQRIHMDYAGPYLNSFWLIVIDGFSRWPEVIETKTMTASTTITELRKIFARFGIPEIIVSDNGSQFTGLEFQDFLTSNGIMHKRSAPYHPATNGLAERFVQTFKNAMSAAGVLSHNLALQQFLFAYRNAPHSITRETPASMMLQFRPRNRLDLLRPQSIAQNSKPKVSAEKSLPKDRNFAEGDQVWARMYNGKSKWIPGVIAKQEGTWHFQIKTDHGILRRHIDQLNKRYLASRPQLDTYQEELTDWGPGKLQTNGEAEESHDAKNKERTSNLPVQQQQLPIPKPDSKSAQPSRRRFFWQKQTCPAAETPDHTESAKETTKANEAQTASSSNQQTMTETTKSPRYSLRRKPTLPIHAIMLTCMFTLFAIPPIKAATQSDVAANIQRYNFNTTILPLIRLVNDGEIFCNFALNFVMHEIARKQRLTLQDLASGQTLQGLASDQNTRPADNQVLFFISMVILGVVIVILVVTVSRVKDLNCPCKMTCTITARRRRRYPRSLPISLHEYRELQGNRRLAIGYP